MYLPVSLTSALKLLSIVRYSSSIAASFFLNEANSFFRNSSNAYIRSFNSRDSSIFSVKLHFKYATISERSSSSFVYCCFIVLTSCSSSSLVVRSL